MPTALQRVVVVGNGMVGQRFVDDLLETNARWHVTAVSYTHLTLPTICSV